MFQGEIDSRERLFKRRVDFIYILIICGFFLLAGRIVWLQLIEGERFSSLSENFRLQLLPLTPPRGHIRDRNGKILATNKVSFSLGVVPSNISDVDCLLISLEKIVGINKERCKKKIQQAPNPFRPVLLKKDVNMATMTYILEREEEFPGVVIVPRPVRSYPHQSLASHLLGYLGEVSKEELFSGIFPHLEQGDFIGRVGIERVYDSYLRGEKGGKQVEVDAYGRYLRTISEKNALPGNDIYLTIDIRMQQIAEEEMGKRKGVVILGNPWTGEIFSLVSHPCFDPNLFSSGISIKEWDRLKQNPANPLENRAIRGEYPPASTFKIIVAISALENGIIGENETFICRGKFLVGDRIFRCWKEEGHGKLNLEDAIIHSCDIFFYQLGLKTGVDNIIKTASSFGLGKPTGIDLLSEKSGLLPTPSWKLKNKGETWFRGDTANLSIGQGYILCTPIQMFNLISIIANGGSLFKPYLVREIVSPEGRLIKKNSPQKLRKVPLSSSTLTLLRSALKGVVKRGTGWRADNKVVDISGKTGTAQLTEGKRPHNWFIGYAPSDNPRIAIVVMVEHREEERAIASEIAGKILSRIFTLKLVKDEYSAKKI